MDDGIKHIYAGTFISQGTAGLIDIKLNAPIKSALIGIVVGGLAGVAKEYYYDRKLGRGTFEYRDMGNTFYGSVVGGFKVTFYLKIKEKSKIDYYN